MNRKACEVAGNKSENHLSKLKYKIHSIFVEVKAEITDGKTLLCLFNQQKSKIFKSGPYNRQIPIFSCFVALGLDERERRVIFLPFCFMYLSFVVKMSNEKKLSFFFKKRICF